jgi:Tfp pilus assembly protein PilN
MAEINKTTTDALTTGGNIAGATGNPIGAVVDLLVGLGVGTYTAKQQAKLQEKLGMLTLEEQAKLNAQLLKTQDKNAKLALIENAIKEKEKTKRLPLYIGIGVFVLVLGVATFVLLRRKKA